MDMKPKFPPTARVVNVPDVRFRGLALPSDDFRAIQNQLRSPPLGYVLDLSTARSVAAGSAVVLDIAGNSFYVDGKSDVGNATIFFQDTKMENDQPPLFIGPQFIARVPFTRILLENAAQPGLVLRFFYGVDIDFVPGLSQSIGSIGTIGTITNPITIEEFTYGAAFASNTALALNTNEVIVAPASNVAGLDLKQLCAVSGSASGTILTFLAKASAPASSIDGDLLAALVLPSVSMLQPTSRAVKIATGKGLYARSGAAAEAANQNARSALYTLLT